MKRILAMAVACGLAATSGAALAGTINLSLGPSTQDFTSVGVNNGGYEGYQLWDLEQGSCSGTGTTTCTLSGAFTSSVPGLTSGNWSFVTQYNAGATPQGIAEAYFGNGNNPNVFNYVYIDASTSMILTLQSGGSSYVIPMVTDGNFDSGTGFSFAYTGTETCTGLSASTPCELATVGLVAGATISGPEIVSVSLLSLTKGSVPEPATLGLLGLGLAAIGLTRRRRRMS